MRGHGILSDFALIRRPPPSGVDLGQEAIGGGTGDLKGQLRALDERIANYMHRSKPPAPTDERCTASAR